jgi:integrase
MSHCALFVKPLFALRIAYHHRTTSPLAGCVLVRCLSGEVKMATAKGELTKRLVEAVAVPTAGKREYLWDGKLSGFGVMVTDKGVRSYIVQYRVGGRGFPTRRFTIGKHGSPWTTDGARNRAKGILEQVRNRVDPLDAEREKRKSEMQTKVAAKAAAIVSARLAFSIFADRYVEERVKTAHPKRWQETESIIRRDLKPHFGDRSLPLITDADVSELLDQVQHQRGDSAAIKAYKALRGIFGYASEKEKRYMPAAKSPMIGLRPPATIRKRQRTLNDAELRLVWLAADEFGYPFTPLVRLLIITGQRLREVAEATWDEIDLDRAGWLIPGARTKNNEPMLVPLPADAVRLLRELPRVPRKIQTAAGKPSPFLFTTTGETPVSGFSKVKARLDKLVTTLAAQEAEATNRDASIVEPWRLHDIRRSFANGLQRMGTDPEIVEAALNHISGTKGGVAGVYQTYRYEPEVRKAVRRWAEHLLAVTSRKPAGRKDPAAPKVAE